jgi:SnoaL-like domain
VSAANVEVVKENIEAVSASGFDPEIAQMRLHPDLRIHSPDEWLGSGTYEGGPGLGAVLSEWRANFDDLHVDIGHLIEDDDRVIALLEVHGRSRSSDVDVEWRLGYIASDFDDAMPRDITCYMSWETALAAAGLDVPAE